MTTFDQILPRLGEIFRTNNEAKEKIGPIAVNRDLNGRVRLIVNETIQEDGDKSIALKAICDEIEGQITAHTVPAARIPLFERDILQIMSATPSFPLEGIEGVNVIDRLATEGNWSSIRAESNTAQRIVFFSIKGGVGRSTALAASAWSLAEQGKRVLLLDLDLESPGLSTSILPDDRRPAYGITDWLVEDLVDNQSAVFNEMVATSPLSHNGEIYVVPAHGSEPGEYLAKLGRVWMPKVSPDGTRESWPQRLQRLIDQLEERWQPDVILIDSRAGIDEVGSACVTDLGANLVLLFAIEGEQTWTGYRMLFRHWLKTGVAQQIRERLQMVGAMLPDTNRVEYFDQLRERSWVLFSEELYDVVPPGAITGEDIWSFDDSDETAPHYPWPINWSRGFAGLRSLHRRIEQIEPSEVRNVFGVFIDGLSNFVGNERGSIA